MTGRLAVGVGCRKRIAGEVIFRQIEAALVGLPRPVGLFTVEDKRGEVGLIEAAERLELPLAFLSREILAAMEGQIVTPSPAAQTFLGVPSVAEASALAAFAGRVRLIVPRRAESGVTVAIAEEVLE